MRRHASSRATALSASGQLGIGALITPLVGDWTASTIACAVVVVGCITAATIRPLVATVVAGVAFALWLNAVYIMARREGDCEPIYTIVPILLAAVGGGVLFLLSLFAAAGDYRLKRRQAAAEQDAAADAPSGRG